MANECRSVCVVTRLLKPLRFRTCWQSRFRVPSVSGCSGLWPGNSHSAGRCSSQ